LLGWKVLFMVCSPECDRLVWDVEKRSGILLKSPARGKRGGRGRAGIIAPAYAPAKGVGACHVA
jgi:hypothetical protein